MRLAANPQSLAWFVLVRTDAHPFEIVNEASPKNISETVNVWPKKKEIICIEGGIKGNPLPMGQGTKCEST